MTFIDFSQQAFNWLGVIALLGTGVAVLFGAFDKGRGKIEKEKDDAAEKILSYYKETNNILQQNNVNALQRVDEATLLITRKDEENKAIMKQLDDYKQILSGNDHVTKNFREYVLGSQKIIIENQQKTNANIERIAKSIEKHVARNNTQQGR